MNPGKTKTIKGHKIEEFYWAGRNVVYIDHILAHRSFCDITVENVESVIKKTLLELKRSHA